VEKGTDINKNNNEGLFPIIETCKNGNEALTKILIEHVADINKQCRNGWTPLLYSCQEGHDSIVKYLIENGANINEETNDGRTPLFNACQSRHITLVKYLVKHGVNLNKEGNNDWILLFYACQNRQEDVVKYLIDKNKEKLNNKYIKSNKYSMVKDIIMDGMFNENKLNSEQLQIIIEMCAPVLNTISPLIKKLMNDNNKEILELLLKNNLKFFDNEFILTLLKYYERKMPLSDSELYPEINNDKYKISVELDETFDHYDSSFYLFNSCKRGNKAAVKLLLEHGADINIEDCYSWTPLFIAC